MAESQKCPRVNRNEIEELLHRELSALPEEYQLPVILCNLERRTREEVAAELNLPEYTVSRRLAMAHRMLSKRMARRGVAVSDTAMSALLAQIAAECVPATLVESTIETTSALLAGEAVAGNAAALSEDFLQAMGMKQLRNAQAFLSSEPKQRGTEP